MTVPRKRILFFVFNLSGGGAERVVTRILSFLDRERFEPFLALKEREGAFLSEVPEDVPILDCRGGEAGGKLLWGWHYSRLIRRVRPDLVVSFMWYGNMASVIARAMSGIRCRLIVSERLTARGSSEGGVLEALRGAGFRMLYPLADRILSNSRAMRDQLVREFHLPAKKVVSIPNPVDIDRVVRNSGGDPEITGVGGSWIVGAGRLARQKGFDTLIRAMAWIREDATLVLLGDGKERERLESVAGEVGVSGRVRFAGFRRNPFPAMSRASVFVLSSRYEGFPNVLLEAMALGVPCVAARCPTGPEEIVTNGVDGLLVPPEDAPALAEAIERLLSDEVLRKRIGEAAGIRARDFDAPEIVRRYEALFEEVMA